MIEVLDFLFLEPWRALGQLAATLLGALAAITAAGYGLAAWMRVDDPNRSDR